MLSDVELDRISCSARTPKAKRQQGISDVLPEAICDLAKRAPASANGSPPRVAFLRARSPRPAFDEACRLL